MRILATTSNVDKLFEKAEMDYAYDDKVVKIQCLQCRTCGWKSLMGVRGLPFPHECNPVIAAVADVTQRFEG